MEHSSNPYSALRPVKLLKDGLKVLHGSVCDQHDGLVTHAALTVHPRLQTNSWTTQSKPDFNLPGTESTETTTNLVQDLEGLLHGILDLCLSFNMQLLHQQLKVLRKEERGIVFSSPAL